MPAKARTPNFETALSRLDTLVQRMESGEQSLDAALKDFETGIGLVRQCREQLNSAEQRVEVLLQEADGDVTISELAAHDTD